MSDNELNIRNQLTAGEKTDWFTIMDITALDVDTYSGEFICTNPNLGLMLKVIAATEAGTFSGTINLSTTDPAGNRTTIYTSAAITAAGTTLFYVNKGGGTNGLFTIVPFAIPRVWSVLVDVT